jgi:ribulose-5-phosphate 4-epimerase/fuculose-1-phosphate aldolase
MSLSLESKTTREQLERSKQNSVEQVLAQFALDVLRIVSRMGHGSFSWGKTPGQTYLVLDHLNESSQILERVVLPSPHITPNTFEDAPASSNNGEET